MPISTLLVANRGEIAVRILRSAQQMGLRTVLAVSEVDQDSMAAELADAVAVVGLGGVGLAAVLVAKAVGCRRVIAVDALPEKLGMAQEFGADEALTPDELVALEDKPRVVIEAAGNTRAFETAVALTDVGGTTVTVGLPAPNATSTVTPLVLTAEARTIVGMSGGVDSSVAALRLRDAAEPIAGLFMSNWADDGTGDCRAEDDRRDAVRERLDDVHSAIGPVLRRLGVIDESLKAYRPRLQAALDKFDNRENNWLASPLIDSYHTVWMQLHQHLILMLGLTRAEDEAREERLVSGRAG